MCDIDRVNFRRSNGLRGFINITQKAIISIPTVTGASSGFLILTKTLMTLFNTDKGEITKQYERTEAEIQQIVTDYLWLTRPDPTQLNNLTSLIKRLRTELHDEFDSMGGIGI